jgi:hypothetical protein
MLPRLEIIKLRYWLNALYDQPSSFRLLLAMTKSQRNTGCKQTALCR